ncbi:MAG: orotidine-5'-phosphate decarboxylase [Desulfosarcinaceae bacterium]|nr:orotidine-5'-phosphate decarboxylase [Desulfosarcinaceae bacterium]
MSTDARERLIFALDVPEPEMAYALIEQLSGHVGLFKVGLELFVRCGPAMIHHIREEARVGVFLDLKLHDIPATVERTMARIADLGVQFATVHCGESPEMLAAAVRGSGGQVGVLGVTVLTSVSADALRLAGFGDGSQSALTELVRQRAAIAKSAGVQGVVCSGLEAAALKADLGEDFLAVTPGIRPAEAAAAGDQQRVVTPGAAIAAGADYLVVGRPIRDARDPAAAADAISAEIAAAL